MPAVQSDFSGLQHRQGIKAGAVSGIQHNTPTANRGPRSHRHLRQGGIAYAAPRDGASRTATGPQQGAIPAARHRRIAQQKVVHRAGSSAQHRGPVSEGQPLPGDQNHVVSCQGTAGVVDSQFPRRHRNRNPTGSEGALPTNQETFGAETVKLRGTQDEGSAAPPGPCSVDQDIARTADVHQTAAPPRRSYCIHPALQHHGGGRIEGEIARIHWQTGHREVPGDRGLAQEGVGGIHFVFGPFPEDAGGSHFKTLHQRHSGPVAVQPVGPEA